MIKHPNTSLTQAVVLSLENCILPYKNGECHKLYTLKINILIIFFTHYLYHHHHIATHILSSESFIFLFRNVWPLFLSGASTMCDIYKQVVSTLALWRHIDIMSHRCFWFCCCCCQSLYLQHDGKATWPVFCRNWVGGMLPATVDDIWDISTTLSLQPEHSLSFPFPYTQQKM